jgi:hypothetical protein
MQTLLTQREAAAQFRVSGDGPTYVKAGRLVRYREQDLEKWIASRVVGSTSEGNRP